MITILDKINRFVTQFNPVDGFYIRSGIIDENGKDSGIDPFMAEFPHLVDVGIMGSCEHGLSGLCMKSGSGCYQNGASVQRPDMTFDDFKSIIKQCSGRTFQFALGGRGDPNKHQDFEEILKICRDNNIVPNYTTSGYNLSDSEVEVSKQYCGAVAVSWYRRDYTADAIQRFIAAGVKTNIHYVVNRNTIEEAIERMKKGDFPEDINAVVFLLYKPIGQGNAKNILTTDDEKTIEFFRQIESSHLFKVGVDSCIAPGIITYGTEIAFETIDTCDGGRFSCYIDSEMNMLPCSFGRYNQYSVSLKKMTIAEAWHSSEFDRFRDKLKNACFDCRHRDACMGGCPFLPEIVLCDEPERIASNKL